jgi:hypothetical protein
MAMVIGKFRVPIVKTTLVMADGEFSTHCMIELSHSRKKTNYVGEWLWKAIGVDVHRSASETWHLPLLAELRTAIAAKRGKRGRDGKYRDASGNMLPSLLEICIRGRTVLAENDLTCLRVNLAESIEMMNWFLAELWSDAHVRQPRLLQEGAPGKGGGKRGLLALCDAAQSAVDAALASLRLHERVKGVTFDRANGRIKMTTLDSGKAVYFSVKNFNRHLAGEALGSEDWAGIMSDVVDNATIFLNDGEPGAPLAPADPAEGGLPAGREAPGDSEPAPETAGPGLA